MIILNRSNCVTLKKLEQFNFEETNDSYKIELFVLH